jgi:hypothetical protein
MVLLVLREERVVLGACRIELPAQHVVVLLQLLRLPPRASVLEPDCHLPRLQPQRARQLRLALRLKLVGHLEAPLQRAHLLQAQPPLPLAAAPARRGRPLLVVRRRAAVLQRIRRAQVVAHGVGGVHGRPVAADAAAEHLRRRHRAGEVVEEGAERRGRRREEVLPVVLLLLRVVVVVMEGLLHLEEEVCWEGGSHAIGGHIGFITGAAGGAWAEYIYQSQGKREGERGWLSVCDREA